MFDSLREVSKRKSFWQVSLSGIVEQFILSGYHDTTEEVFKTVWRRLRELAWDWQFVSKVDGMYTITQMWMNIDVTKLHSRCVMFVWDCDNPYTQPRSKKKRIRRTKEESIVKKECKEINEVMPPIEPTTIVGKLRFYFSKIYQWLLNNNVRNEWHLTHDTKE